MQSFYICPEVQFFVQWTSSKIFFLILEFLAESSTKPFRDARELHS